MTLLSTWKNNCLHIEQQGGCCESKILRKILQGVNEFKLIIDIIVYKLYSMKIYLDVQQRKLMIT